MAMLEVKKDFSRRELMWFGPLFALFIGLISIVLMRRFQLTAVTYGLWVATAVLIVLYYLIPKIQRSVYRGWFFAVLPIGWVISHLMLAAVFYLLVTPIGLALRVAGYDSMQRQIDRSISSYWSPINKSTGTKRYFRQY